MNSDVLTVFVHSPALT